MYQGSGGAWVQTLESILENVAVSCETAGATSSAASTSASESVAVEPGTAAFEVCRRLVQVEDLIAKIHEEELPPEEYYEELEGIQNKILKGVTRP